MRALIEAAAGEVNRGCGLLASDALMSSSLTGLPSFRIEWLTSANQPGAHEHSHEATAKWDGVPVMAIRAAALNAQACNRRKTDTENALSSARLSARRIGHAAY
jgi:hypothetical protein